MNDLYQSAVSRDDFQRWLGLGTAPLTVYQGEKAAATLLKLEKNASVDYLYQTAAQDNSVSWNNPVQFCGVYDRKSRTLYLTKDAASLLAKGQFPFVAEAGPSMKDEITSAVNGRVESIKTVVDDDSHASVTLLSHKTVLRRDACKHLAASDTVTLHHPLDAQVKRSIDLPNGIDHTVKAALIEDGCLHEAHGRGLLRAPSSDIIADSRMDDFIQALQGFIVSKYNFAQTAAVNASVGTQGFRMDTLCYGPLDFLVLIHYSGCL